MFRKTILNHRLRSVAMKLIRKYGYASFYKEKQIESVLRKGQRDERYAYLLFKEFDKESVDKEYLLERKSLYRYFDEFMSDAEIDKNEYYKIIYIGEKSEIEGANTAIGINANIMHGTGKS